MTHVEELDELAYSRASQDAWKSFLETRFDAHRQPGLSGRAARLRIAELELESLCASSAFAKQRRNTATPCGCLPPEILAIIFAFAQATWKPQRVWPDEVDKETEPRYKMGWLTVLHVISSWRETALNSPQLWLELDCLQIHPQLMSRTLLCSRRMPLQVHVHPIGSTGLGTNETLELVQGWLCAPVIRRTEKLMIVAKDHEFNSWMSTLSAPGLILKDLEIQALRWKNRPCHIEDTVFAGRRLPMLTALSLISCLPSWQSHLFSPNLTSLRLSLAYISFEENFMDGHDFLPTAATFKKLLAPMKSLIELHLNNFFPRDDETTEPPLALPSTLETFECTCDAWDAFNEYHHNLWRCIKIPRQTLVIFEVLIEEFENITDNITGDVLTPLLVVDDPAHLVRELYLSTHTASLQYLTQERSGWTWKWPREPHDPEDIRADRGLLNYGRAPGSRHALAWTDMPKIVLPQLTLEKLQALNFSSDATHHYAGPADWIDAFGGARDVERIAIPFLNSLDLLSALVEEDGGNQYALFPNLQIIVIHKGSPYMDKASTHHAAIDLSLVQVIEMRRQGGVPIRELLVDECMASWDVWGRVRESTIVTFFQ